MFSKRTKGRKKINKRKPPSAPPPSLAQSRPSHPFPSSLSAAQLPSAQLSPARVLPSPARGTSSNQPRAAQQPCAQTLARSPRPSSRARPPHSSSARARPPPAAVAPHAACPRTSRSPVPHVAHTRAWACARAPISTSPQPRAPRSLSISHLFSLLSHDAFLSLMLATVPSPVSLDSALLARWLGSHGGQAAWPAIRRRGSASYPCPLRARARVRADRCSLHANPWRAAESPAQQPA
jgi:hypothetical protein